MNEILSMREKRAKLWDATKAFVESRKDANGTLSAEDTATYEKMEADVVRMGKEIERLERQEALDLEFDRPISRPLVDKPLSPEDKPRKTGSASDEYKSAFWHAMRDKSVINFTIRYRADVVPGMWVIFRGKKWFISTLGEYGFRRDYLGLKASLSEGVSG